MLRFLFDKDPPSAVEVGIGAEEDAEVVADDADMEDDDDGVADADELAADELIAEALDDGIEDELDVAEDAGEDNPPYVYKIRY